jgi:nicotinamide riboside kinase
MSVSLRGREQAMSQAAFVVTLLGAESTGKTTLASALGERLGRQGLRTGVVDEALRQFCSARGRTPRREEQAAIAALQSARIDEAARANDVVVADTSALMIAVYSEMVFADTSLYASALAAQRGYGLTLVTALDLPWQADGLQRDGPHVRAPVDALLRSALAGAGIAFATVGGIGAARVEAALRLVDAALAARTRASP